MAVLGWCCCFVGILTRTASFQLKSVRQFLKVGVELCVWHHCHNAVLSLLCCDGCVRVLL